MLAVLSPTASAATDEAAQPQELLRNAAAAFQAGDTATSIRLYREFLKDYPDAAEIRSNLGAALVKDGQLAEAITEYQAAIQKIPNNPRVRMNLALANYKLGKLPEAVKELETLYGLQPLEIEVGFAAGRLPAADRRAAKGGRRCYPRSWWSIPTTRPSSTCSAWRSSKRTTRKRRRSLLDRILRSGESAESAYLLGQSEYLRNNILLRSNTWSAPSS